MLTLLKTIGMEEKNIYFEDVPFERGKVDSLDMDAVNTGIDLGNRCLEYQYKTIYSIRDNCKMLLGWLIGAMMALTGALTATVVSETPDLIILISAGYELIFAFLIAATIIHGTMFRKTVFFPGDSPSHIFSDKSLQALKDFDDVRTRYIKGWHLEEIQFRIMQNKKEQLHEVTVYRRALALCLTAILSGAALVTTLFLFGL